MKKILVVEDDQSIVDILEMRLNVHGFETVVARDGKDGLDKVKALRPDLIILDVGIPKVDGLTVCEVVKKDQKLQKIPILMLTAKNTVGDWESGFKAGADAYINKPFKWDNLLESIEDLTKD